MEGPNRPQPMPFTEGQRGGPLYSSEEVGAYRRAMGITGDALAQYLGTKRPAISRWESPNTGVLSERTATRLLDAVEYLVRRRTKMMAEGRAQLDAIQARHAKYAADMRAWAERRPSIADTAMAVTSRRRRGTAR